MSAMPGQKILLLAGALLFALPLVAASGKAEKYPLRLQVRKTSRSCQNCDGGGNPHNIVVSAGGGRFDSMAVVPDTVDPDPHYTGRGTGVLVLDNSTAEVIRFNYSYCIDPLTLSQTAFMSARWKRPGRELEVLVPLYKPHKPVDFATKRLSKCEVNIMTQTQAVPFTLPPAAAAITAKH